MSAATRGLLDTRWAAFRAEESAASKKDARHLVRPGGSYDANLCFVLHYPPFCSSQVYDGKTYDPGCVSINTLIRSGFDDQKALWMDMYCRRSGLRVGTGDQKERFLPVKHVEKSLLDLHIDWAKLVLRSSTATILVIFGKPNRLYLEKLWKDRLEEVTLWDVEETKFCILWGEGDEPNRLVFFLWHPEYLTQRKDPDTGKRYDQQLAVIAQMAGIHQSAEQQSYQEDESQGLREKYHDTHGATLSRAARLGVLKRKTNPAKEKKGLKLRADTTIEVQCYKCGFIRLDTTPYFIQKGVDEFYVVANAYCPVCAEEEGKSVGDGLCRWYIPTDSLMPWVKDDPRYLTRSSADIKQFAESFSGPGTDNVAGLAEAIEGVYGGKPVVKKRLAKRGDKGGRRPPDYTKKRVYCYYVDLDTEKACTSSYTQLGSLKGHFTKEHPKATWDKTRVTWRVGKDNDAGEQPANEAPSEAPSEAPGNSISKLVPHSKVVPTDYLDDYAGEDDETPQDTAASYQRTAARAKAKPTKKHAQSAFAKPSD